MLMSRIPKRLRLHEEEETPAYIPVPITSALGAIQKCHLPCQASQSTHFHERIEPACLHLNKVARCQSNRSLPRNDWAACGGPPRTLGSRFEREAIGGWVRAETCASAHLPSGSGKCGAVAIVARTPASSVAGKREALRRRRGFIASGRESI
ncbi:hypothetical protein IQ06DRAFT_66477 [Phaeosphaeriaceae sp. SRC1lsM3a]|nr:hypothetical protein IQ06DRAFT_66477 [Stagonospora sp. SRC1lsM3a]